MPVHNKYSILLLARSKLQVVSAQVQPAALALPLVITVGTIIAVIPQPRLSVMVRRPLTQSILQPLVGCIQDVFVLLQLKRA